VTEAFVNNSNRRAGHEAPPVRAGRFTEGAEYIIGSAVSCSDGACGELRRVVVDPVARALTHLVVEAKHRQGRGRLVPVDLVISSGPKIQLGCATAEFEALEHAEEERFLPGALGEWGYRQDQMFSWPYFGLGTGDLGMSPAPQSLTSDRVPSGGVEVRRGEYVHATDGPVGRVKGLVVDPSDHHVTHVLLDEGHLWGKKMVAIPIGAVTSVEDGVRLGLTKDEVGDLPAVDVDDPV
jgi:hypothetical protein